MLKSKAGVVWVLKSWAEVTLTSAPWKTPVLDYPICAEALTALPAFPLLQRLSCQCYFCCRKLGLTLLGGFAEQDMGWSCTEIKSWTPVLAAAQGSRSWWKLRECLTAPKSPLLLPAWTLWAQRLIFQWIIGCFSSFLWNGAISSPLLFFFFSCFFFFFFLFFWQPVLEPDFTGVSRH